MMKFKVGDRVTLRPGLVLGRQYQGLTFLDSMQKFVCAVLTIEDVLHGGLYYQCAGTPYTFAADMLMPYTDGTSIADSKIVITTDGKTTMARLYHGRSLIDIETARCHPTDKFRFDEGVRIAVDRLLEKYPSRERPQYYTGRLVCADNEDARFTYGKIYNVDAGNISDDEGVVYSTEAVTAEGVELIMRGEFGCRARFIEIAE